MEADVGFLDDFRKGRDKGKEAVKRAQGVDAEKSASAKGGDRRKIKRAERKARRAEERHRRNEAKKAEWQQKKARLEERKSRNSSPLPPSIPISGIVRLKKGRRQTIYVVGESHYQKEISSLYGREGREAFDWSTWATLQPEPENPYDSNAVQVKIDGVPLGHLDRGDARAYGEALRAAGALGVTFEVRANVGAYGPGEGETTNAGVTLSVPSPNDLQVLVQSYALSHETDASTKT